MKPISIICKRADPVTEVTELLSNRGIDIRDLNFIKVGSDAILTLLVSDEDLCIALLTAAGFTTIPQETVLLKAEDRPGMLAQISRRISDLGVEIRSMALLDIDDRQSVVAICTSDNDKIRTHFSSSIIS
jgi:hypothetical protein